MPLILGPVLSFRGCADNNWNVTALVVSKSDPGALSVAGRTLDPDMLWQHRKGTVYRYTLAVPLTPAAQSIAYSVAGNTYTFAVPAAGQVPTMAYASCNGFSSLRLAKTVKDHNCVWRLMADKHRQVPYHLLLQGGDQVYADGMWEVPGPMQNWVKKDWKAGNAAKPSAAMQKQLDDFYFDLYTKSWSEPEIATLFASIPSIAMWDDHDLIDGWGSYEKDRQDCPVYGAIWQAASKAYATFQQHLAEGERRPGSIGAAPADWWQQPVKQIERKGAFSFGYTIGNIAILAADLRSQRTAEQQVVSEGHWDEIYQWIDALDPASVSHLLVMSSIPVVYPDFKTVENLLDFFPGHQDLEDDLRDHWNSPPHKGERLRLVHRLLKVSKKIRTTILAGDVHVGALGLIQSDREVGLAGNATVVNQLISSGIVHPGPGAVVIFALQNLFDSNEEIDRGIVGRMTPFPGSKVRFVGTRNYLSLEPDASSRIWCNWLIENEPNVLTKVIHPLATPIG